MSRGRSRCRFDFWCGNNERDGWKGEPADISELCQFVFHCSRVNPNPEDCLANKCIWNGNMFPTVVKLPARPQWPPTTRRQEQTWETMVSRRRSWWLGGKVTFPDNIKWCMLSWWKIQKPADIACFSHISSFFRPEPAFRVGCCEILHPDNLESLRTNHWPSIFSTKKLSLIHHQEWC